MKGISDLTNRIEFACSFTNNSAPDLILEFPCSLLDSCRIWSCGGAPAEFKALIRRAHYTLKNKHLKFDDADGNCLYFSRSEDFIFLIDIAFI